MLNDPDQRTRLSDTTRQRAFVTYAPAGIAPADVQAHLEQIADNVRLVDPRPELVELVILRAELT